MTTPIYIFDSNNGCMTFNFPHIVHIDTASHDEDYIRATMSAYLDKPCFLLLEGGADINPKIYNQENRRSWFNDFRDAREILQVKVAEELGIPIMGICRGHQLLAALRGGNLYQDLDEAGTDHDGRHDVMCTGDEGFIAAMLGIRNRVNSLHHQAVNVVPQNARVIARCSTDNVVEGLIYDDALTVQWHPELMGHRALFDYFVSNFVTRSLHSRMNMSQSASIAFQIPADFSAVEME